MSYKIKQRTQKAGVGTRKKLEEVSTKEAGSVEDDHFLPGGGHQPGGAPDLPQAHMLHHAWAGRFFHIHGAAAALTFTSACLDILARI